MYGGEELFPGGLGGEASSLFSLDSGGLLADGAALPKGNYIPGAVGSYLAYDTLTNPDASEFHNAGQGALAGAGIGFTAGGPVGAGIGAAVGGIGGLARGLMDHTSPREKERKREQSMYGQGIAGYDYFRDRTDSERDAARGAADSSSPDFVGKDPRTGLWVNNKYGKGGYNERDLRPEDIWGTPDFFEHYGNDWLGKFSEEERRQKAQQALDSGAVRSKDGGIRVDFGKIGQNQQAVPSDREGGRNVAVTPSPKAPTGTNPTGGPVRLSPGVYKDPRTGKVFLSKTGRQ
jgi:hypothetical protein